MAELQRGRKFYRVAWLWVTWFAAVVGGASTFLNFSGQVGVYSGNYGLPSQAWLVEQANARAGRDLWILAALGIIATVLTAILVPLPKDVSSTPGRVSRLLVAGVLTALSVVALAFGLQVFHR